MSQIDTHTRIKISRHILGDQYDGVNPAETKVPPVAISSSSFTTKTYSEREKSPNKKKSPRMRRCVPEEFRRYDKRVIQRWRSLTYREPDSTISIPKVQEIISQKICSYCGMHIDTLGKSFRNNNIMIEVDRMNPKMSYNDNNVTPACSICNHAKSNWLYPRETRLLMSNLSKIVEDRK